MPCPTVCPRLREARAPRSRSSAATTASLWSMQRRMRSTSSACGPGSAGHALHPLEQLRALQQPVLDDLGEAAGELARRQRGQRVGVHHHQLGLPDRADVVLALGQVHARLSADGRVDHRQERRGHLEQTDAALVGGRDEAHQVPHHAPAQGGHGVAAPEPGLGRQAAEALHLGQALGALAGRDGRADDAEAALLQGRARPPREPRDVAVAHEHHARPGGPLGPELAQAVEDPRPEVDREAGLADLGPAGGSGRRGPHRVASAAPRCAHAATRAATSSAGPSASTSRLATSR